MTSLLTAMSPSSHVALTSSRSRNAVRNTELQNKHRWILAGGWDTGEQPNLSPAMVVCAQQLGNQKNIRENEGSVHQLPVSNSHSNTPQLSMFMVKK